MRKCIWGWRPNRSCIVPGTIRSLLRGERPIIRSDGTPKRDYVYVKDVARAYIRLAENVGTAAVTGAAFNFSLGVAMTVLEMVGNDSANYDARGPITSSS